MSSDQLTRRKALQVCCAAALAGTAFDRVTCGASGRGTSNVDHAMREAAQFVQPRMNWSAVELNDFLNQMPPEGLLSLKKALELVDSKATVHDLKGGPKDVAEIQAQLLWVSTNVFAYPLSDEKKIAYHDLVRWVAADAGVDQWVVDTQSTFVIERAYQEQLFISIWNKLSAEQRQQLLTRIEQSFPKDAPGGPIADKGAIAALSGAGALAVLLATEYFAHFAFYTTMSVVLCTVAGWFGVTLPFAAYASSSSAIAFLCGPVGWAILAIAAAAGIAIAGRANSKKTGAAIWQLHALKVAALQDAGQMSKDLFQALGDPVKRQIVGKWSWRTRGQTLEFDLKGDGSFTSEIYPDVRPALTAGYGFIHSGKGDWQAHDGKLTIAMTHVWAHAIWVKHEVAWIDQQRIKKLTATEVLLGDGSLLKRK